MRRIVTLAALTALAAGATVATAAVLTTKYVQAGPKLVGTGVAGTPGFGSSVALSADGNTALVGGASYRFGFGGAGSNPAAGSQSGPDTAWVFVRSGSTWRQQAHLKASDEVGQANFGQDVALSADGNTAVVTGSRDSSGVGAAWIFTRAGSTWRQQGHKLTATNRSGSATFGTSVALSGDGKLLLVGGSNGGGGGGGGSWPNAWVFTRTGSTWAEEGFSLSPSFDRDTIGNMALSADGTVAVLGGYGNAWVYTHAGADWKEAGTGLAPKGVRGLGGAVAMSSNGSTILVGDSFDDRGVGSAYAFGRTGSTWAQQGTKLVATGETGSGTFGSSVALSGDGTVALIGGRSDRQGHENGKTFGSAWVFQRSGSHWTQQGTRLVPGGQAGSSSFGASAALSSSGAEALIGGSGDNKGKGAAWTFARSGG